MQKWKRKREKNNARLREKKEEGISKKLHPSIKRSKCAYTEKNHFSLEVNTAILEAWILNFRAKRIKYFGPLKTKKIKFSLIPFVPRLTNINFLLTISIQYQEKRLWEDMTTKGEMLWFLIKFSLPMNFLKERYGEQPGRFACVSSIGSGVISHENDRSALGLV